MTTPSVVFTSLNWNIPQTVYVASVDDALSDGLKTFDINGTSASADTNYNGLAVPKGYFQTYDDEEIRIIVFPETDPGDPKTRLQVTEYGTQTSVQYVLSQAPVANVTVPISSDDTTEGTAAPSSLVFMPSNWNAPQTVTITDVDDVTNDGDKNFKIKAGASTSSDSNWNAKSAADTHATCIDNE